MMDSQGSSTSLYWQELDNYEPPVVQRLIWGWWWR